MTSKFIRRSTAWLLAGLVLNSAEALADNGFSISRSREDAIAIGMSAAEVRQQLGMPASVVRYRNAPGPTWTYKVLGAPFGRTDFNIEFGPNERVVSTGETVIGSEKPSG